MCARASLDDQDRDPRRGIAVTPRLRRRLSQRGRSGNTASTDCDTQPEHLRYDTISSSMIYAAFYSVLTDRLPGDHSWNGRSVIGSRAPDELGAAQAAQLRDRVFSYEHAAAVVKCATLRVAAPELGRHHTRHVGRINELANTQRSAAIGAEPHVHTSRNLGSAAREHSGR